MPTIRMTRPTKPLLTKEHGVHRDACRCGDCGACLACDRAIAECECVKAVRS